MGSKKWDGMELDAKNSMKQVEYCDEGFDNNTPFFIFPLHFIQDIPGYFKEEYDYMGGFMGEFFSRF